MEEKGVGDKECEVREKGREMGENRWEVGETLPVLPSYVQRYMNIVRIHVIVTFIRLCDMSHILYSIHVVVQLPVQLHVYTCTTLCTTEALCIIYIPFM